MRQLQLHAAHQALLIHETALQKLQGAKQPVDVLTIHSDLVSFYLESSSQYWQQVATTGMQTQIELIALLNQTFAGKVLPSSDDVFDAKPESFTKQPFKRLTSVEAQIH